MKRGTTYTHILTIAGVDLTSASEVIVSVKPLGKPPLEFSGDNIVLTSDGTNTVILYKLTEVQSLSLDTGSYQVDVNWMMDGTRGGTHIATQQVSRTLLNRVIGGGDDTPNPDMPEPDPLTLTEEQALIIKAISPKVTSVEHSGNVTLVTITDVNGAQVLSIPDGLQGQRGETGETGATGATGNGIASAILNADYTLTLTFTDGTSYTTPPIRGAQGVQGPQGDDYVLTAQDKAEIAAEVSGMFVVTVSGTTPTITAAANTRYVCGELSTLDFTPSASGICDVIFESGSTPTVLTVPSTVKWSDWFDPTALEANRTYELNVLDGVYGAVGVWS